jgi:HTH-type transcriptional regulator, transcriptional repressor of NAD biosynthesis genes
MAGTKMFPRAVVIGKFYPPHRGHKLLIDRATERSGHVTVIVCAKPTDTIQGELRGAWLREIHPHAHVLVIDDRYDENDTQVWAENTIRWMAGAPDVVFTSEHYGEPYARAMNCTHVMVDRNRTMIPCSGTMIRNDPFAHWDFLEPPVRGWFARRVCVVGAESTGTTTLASMLAEQLQTVWVPEYGREYSAEKFARQEANWTTGEFVHIAAEQNRREEAAARAANRVLICDTNSFATTLWHRRYMNFDSERVRAEAAGARCDLYLLTGDEIPFVQDGLRDGEHMRHEMHAWFEAALRAQSVPWRLLRGTPAERLSAAVEAIQELSRGLDGRE